MTSLALFIEGLVVEAALDVADDSVRLSGWLWLDDLCDHWARGATEAGWVAVRRA